MHGNEMCTSDRKFLQSSSGTVQKLGNISRPSKIVNADKNSGCVVGGKDTCIVTTLVVVGCGDPAMPKDPLYWSSH